jgi:hypothetical protein
MPEKSLLTLDFALLWQCEFEMTFLNISITEGDDIGPDLSLYGIGPPWWGSVVRKALDVWVLNQVLLLSYWVCEHLLNPWTSIFISVKWGDQSRQPFPFFFKNILWISVYSKLY